MLVTPRRTVPRCSAPCRASRFARCQAYPPFSATTTCMFASFLQLRRAVDHRGYGGAKVRIDDKKPSVESPGRDERASERANARYRAQIAACTATLRIPLHSRLRSRRPYLSSVRGIERRPGPPTTRCATNRCRRGSRRSARSFYRDRESQCASSRSPPTHRITFPEIQSADVLVARRSRDIHSRISESRD